MASDKKQGKALMKDGVALFTSCFDGGNGRCVEVTIENGSATFKIEIEEEPYTEKDGRSHYQWFYFQLSNIKNKELTVCITNAGGASYPFAWDNYHTVFSYDRKDWLRVKDTTYDEGILTMKMIATENIISFAYFAPYPNEKHFELIAKANSSPRAEVRSLGFTPLGTSMDLVVIGDEHDEKKNKVWVIARQHPGETMASWHMEGFLGRMLNADDPVARTLLKHAVLYCVPLMCPDGARMGHLRTTSTGANLNREWQEPCEQYSPEVFYVMKEMERVGCDAFIDVHGDEEGIPKWSPRLEKLQMRFSMSYLASSPDFQCKYGYPRDRPGKANLKVASNGVAERYDCLGLTLEMPFKDTADDEEPIRGWSPSRTQIFGAAMVDPLAAVAEHLRT